MISQRFDLSKEKSLSGLAESIYAEYGYGLTLTSKDGHIFYSGPNHPKLAGVKSDFQLSSAVQTRNGEINISLTYVNHDTIPAAFELLKQLEEPIKDYFKVDRQSYVDSNLQQGRLICYSFPQEPSLKTLNSIISNHCNPHAIYYVSVLDNVTLEEQRHYAKNLKDQRTFTISIKGPKYLTLILRHQHNPMTNRIDPSYPSNEERQKMFKEISKTYHGNPRCGIGNSYYPESLALSYQQALFTLCFMKCTGNLFFSTRFQDLGYGLPLLSTDFQTLGNYCFRTVGPVLEYDKANNTDLYQSMQTYLDCNCSSKETADRLFIHTNTIYYRIRKLSQLTGFQVSDIRDSGNLYYVFKCYEALRQSGLLPENAQV